MGRSTIATRLYRPLTDPTPNGHVYVAGGELGRTQRLERRFGAKTLTHATPLGVCGLQREHFKSDWHRLNVKRKLSARVPLTEAAFEAALDGEDLESISGSESVCTPSIRRRVS